MTIYVFSALTNNQTIPFDPLTDRLSFDTGVRPAELLINATASGVQFQVGGKSIVLANTALDDLGLSESKGLQNIFFSAPGVLLVGEGSTAHDGGLANALTGGAGDDALLGLGGDDVLDGGLGGDLMVGGLGNDIYRVDNASDIVTEENNSLAGAGVDTVFASVSYTLTNYVENLILSGTGAINGTGNTLNNQIFGNGSANLLDGKLGADTMVGGDGDDTYVVDNLADKVQETNSTLGQIDTVMASINYALGANLENLTLTGTLGLVGLGNARANVMIGNAGANTLNGGLGADTMTGGDGNDTYIVDSSGDRVIETNNSLSQIDMVASSVSYALGANLENLRLLGYADLNATGNALNNVLYANAGDNVLDGQGGNDTVSYAALGLYGMSASGLTLSSLTYSTSGQGVTVDLTITGVQDTQGSGFDQLVGIENLTGSQFNDELTGNALANILDGNGGADVLTGGRGNDIYVVDGADVVIELNGAAEGIDTVQASVSYRLAANVENLTLTGSALNGTGNALDNVILGNAANNVLDGRAGADKMDGGIGNDTFVVDNLGDEVFDASGTDLVQSYINYNLGSTIEYLRLMGTNALNGTGNALSNIVWVNGANNVVDGGANASNGDTISYEYGAHSGITLDLSITGAQATGGSGLDTVTNFENLIGSAYDDLLSGNAGANVLDGSEGTDTLSYANSAYAVVVDLTAQRAVSNAVTDVVRNFENVVGSAFDDVMTGDLGDNIFVGGAGSDTVSYQNVKEYEGGVVADLSILGAQNTLASGMDTFRALAGQSRSSIENLIGSVNDDSLSGDAYANRLEGSAGQDSLFGGAGDDALVGGLGDDKLYGGAGADTAIFVGTQAATVNLASSQPQNTGSGLDVLSSIENVISGDGADLLRGSSLANAMEGGAGNDTIEAGSGDDLLLGDSGSDVLTGGSGADIFVFNTEAGLSNIDRITDFSVADDTIQLENAIFTGLVAGALSATGFAANASGQAQDSSDRVIYETDSGALFFDADGKGGAAAVQIATLSAGLALTAADFFVI